ncbi:type IV conjugative transfer system lipoprotein TraV [Kosakonia sacchari]|uniref:type IV conjugative transfer system lipoprotein TraV n=1 Tax=Kosakonia sacchari TaxID=1158459 RepID=UPI002ACE93C7|nr:type IV conjugative transfer system lipoprotein TraV [Kosakonia sacchari]MDZ7320173.1 type IV conjugative transfer system lipoprotein TraV [Kosakonia sacchari]
MKINTLLLAGCALLISGCAGVKSRFDCNATTSDSCMTMTKANQLARDKAANQAGKPVAGGLPSLVDIPVTSVAAVPSAFAGRGSSSDGVRPASATPGRGNTRSVTSSRLSRPVTGSSVTNVPRPGVSDPRVSVVTPVPSCQNVRCNNPGTVHPQRSQDQIATVWIAPWVDSDNVFHQPGRVSFVVRPADWVLPSQVN